MEKDWAWLPGIPLDLILKKLVSVRDFACFSAVCKRWNSIAEDTRKKVCLVNESRPQPPFLLIPDYRSSYVPLRLYSVTQKKILHHQFRNPYPNSRGWVGSSRGWLLLADQDLKIYLFNPFSYKEIILPPIPEAAESFSKRRLHLNWFITKAILSSDPVLHPRGFEVSVIYEVSYISHNEQNYRLGVYRSSEKAWTVRQVEDRKFDDIIYHRGKIHLVDKIGIAELLVASDHPALVPVKWTQQTRSCLHYLVENGDGDGDLLLIERFFQNSYPGLTSKFSINRLDPNPGGLAKLVKIKDIGDNEVFVGRHESIMIPTCHFPGLQRNCVYYLTDDLPKGEGDAGVFNLDDGSIERYDNNLPPRLIDDVVWIMPTLTCHDNIKWTKLSSMIHDQL
ncbi:hypothetical protein COLO4_34274 [Corchorus olitorius]|uniref:KIB1-4 beta-propeller domain-containing protein n=1 Tax=Corchorus olitorius TaxID=93759 RepID=A0A1R3GME7_9ROSI|nr:hypothetical protein COLO4_34274 [Corchorus olitorius]